LQADTPGRHPAYLHARSDLRAAQWLMRVHDDANVMRRIRQADVEIERAIHEIDRAARLDRKNMEDHPPSTRIWAEAAVSAKRWNCCNAPAPILAGRRQSARDRWRNVAYRHIDAAIDFVRRAARDLHMEREMGW